MNVKVGGYFPINGNFGFFLILSFICAVCVKTVESFANSLDDNTKKDTKLIEEEFRKFCKTSKNKEHRFVSLPSL